MVLPIRIFIPVPYHGHSFSCVSPSSESLDQSRCQAETQKHEKGKMLPGSWCTDCLLLHLIWHFETVGFMSRRDGKFMEIYGMFLGMRQYGSICTRSVWIMWTMLVRRFKIWIRSVDNKHKRLVTGDWLWIVSWTSWFAVEIFFMPCKIVHLMNVFHLAQHVSSRLNFFWYHTTFYKPYNMLTLSCICHVTQYVFGCAVFFTFRPSLRVPRGSEYHTTFSKYENVSFLTALFM